MNDTDAIQVGAGRELDAAVAEKVMGWTDLRDERDIRWCSVARAEGFNHGVNGGWCGYDPASSTGWLSRVPRYSTDIAAAWDVHRAMCERLFSTRQRYYRTLQEAVAQRMGSFVMAWPDVISFLEPVDFCRAAIAARHFAAHLPEPASVESKCET